MTAPNSPKMEFDVSATRLSAHASQAVCKQASITMDTDLKGNAAAFNPAELLLAALSACMIKGMERVVPILDFQMRGAEVHVHGVRQDVPPRMESISYEIVVDTDEVDRRLDLLHQNIKKYGTVFNTVAPGTNLTGTLRRKTA
ncbi:MAG: OsmC family protein [Pseudomonadota bacterium]